MSKTLQEELDALTEAAAPIKKAFAEPLLSIVAWLDRQLRCWT